jgi:hypothetical protein
MIKEAITIKPWRLFMKSKPWKSRSQKGYFILRWYSFWKYVDGGYFPLGILICFKFNLIHWGCLIDFLGHWVLCGKEYNCSQSLEAPTNHVFWKAGNITAKSTWTEEMQWNQSQRGKCQLTHYGHHRPIWVMDQQLSHWERTEMTWMFNLHVWS